MYCGMGWGFSCRMVLCTVDGVLRWGGAMYCGMGWGFNCNVVLCTVGWGGVLIVM